MEKLDASIGFQLMDELYKAYDPEIQQLQRNSPCKKGYMACCFQYVKLEKIELQKILSKVNKDVKNNIKHNTKKK